MERLPYDPKTLGELVEADLRRAARLIIRVQDEIDPQFRIATPEGDYWIAVTLPSDPYGRKVILRNLALFMAWKQALGFTLASELYEPDSAYCVGFMHKERHACLARRLPDSSIDPALSDLLPHGAREMTTRDLATVEKWFGSRGKFRGVKMNTGELGI
jgi:hypothetical protein